MSNDGALVPVQMDLATIQSTGELLWKSGYFSDAKSAAQAAVKVMAGAELGIPPFASMTGIHIIQGKPCLSAGIMAGKVKSSGRYDFRVVTLTDEMADIAFLERGVEIGRSQFSIADAKKAQTQNLGKFPRNMLYARAMSNGVKWFCPDIFLGPIYTPEEMGATVNEETGEVIELQPEPRPTPKPAERRPDGTRKSTADHVAEHQQHVQDATNGEGISPECKPHFVSHIGWLKNHKDPILASGIDVKDKEQVKAFSLFCLNAAAGREMGSEPAPWTTRKDLTVDDWRVNETLVRWTDADVARAAGAFLSLNAADEADPPGPDAEPEPVPPPADADAPADDGMGTTEEL